VVWNNICWQDILEGYVMIFDSSLIFPLQINFNSPEMFSVYLVM
jgi:hypothetical protein